MTAVKMNVDNTSQPCYTEAAKIREENIVSAPIPIGPTLSQIGQIFVNVKDLDRAIAFYRDTLGMTFLFQSPPTMALFDCGGIRIMLGFADNPQVDPPSSVIYCQV